jgi:hypothetical protein
MKVESANVRNFAAELLVATKLAAIDKMPTEWSAKDKVFDCISSMQLGGIKASLAGVPFKLVGEAAKFSVVTDSWTLVCSRDYENQLVDMIGLHSSRPTFRTSDVSSVPLYTAEVFGRQEIFQRDITMMMLGGANNVKND